jgi:protein-S-isoprenylcysteine O-methyltransferase Ste14
VPEQFVTELQIHGYLVLTTIALAVITFVSLFRVTAPYGRHLRTGWGPTIPARIGWVVMESPAVLLFAAIFFMGEHADNIVPLVFLLLWQFHYLNRTFVFPFRMRSTHKRMPVVIAIMAIFFNCLNAYINARWISHFGTYPDTWFVTVPFVLGVLFFVSGWLINQQADAVLFRLRQPRETDYKIPRGGMYRWISCPNYFGEMLEWIGWAIATWPLAGSAFAIFTIANLFPRALANHRWYQAEFPDYPANRRAVIPGLL